jgi:hypothetical protein
MPDEQEIEIDFNEAVAAAANGAESAKAEPKVEVVASDDKAISELKRQYDDLKKRDESRAKAIEAAERSAAEANANAQRASAEAEQVKTQIVSTELQSAIDRLGSAKSEADAAEREYTTAMEAQNWAEAAKAQRRLSKAEANQVAFERDKQYLESRQVVSEGRVEPQQRRAPADPFEAAISRLTPKSQAWLRDHPDCVTDDEMRAKAGAADAAARKRGLRADSDEYFQFAEEYLGYNQNAKSSEPTRRTMPAAPVSRESSSLPNNNTAKVKLSSGEVTAATDGTIQWNTGPNKGKPIGVNEMARRKALLEREGAYTKRLPS